MASSTAATANVSSPCDAVGQAPEHPGRVRREVRIRRACAARDVASEHVRPALLVDLGCRENDLPGPLDGLDQGVVRRRVVGLLGELEVVGDDAGAVGGDAVDRRRVLGSRNDVEVDGPEALLVELDEDDVRRRLLGAADCEASVERCVLELSEDVRPVADQDGSRQPQPHAEEKRRTQAPAAPSSAHGHTVIDRAAAHKGRVAAPGL